MGLPSCLALRSCIACREEAASRPNEQLRRQPFTSEQTSLNVYWCRRYEDAARLRDESYTGLVGWWAGRGEDDPYGHLLHISAGYSSYTGRAYLPRQLFEIRVCGSSCCCLHCRLQERC